MKITHVEVEYRELRSSGYPSFTNVTHGVCLRAHLGLGDDPEAIREQLRDIAIREVKGLHGDHHEIADAPPPADRKSMTDAKLAYAALSTALHSGHMSPEVQLCLAQLNDRLHDLDGDIPF